MNVIKKLSSSTGKRSKEANKAFGKEIADNNDRKSIKELTELLDNKDRNIQSDSIEVLYETGYIKPDLIADYYKIFLELIKDKNNRLVWGAMIALSSISAIIPEFIYKELPEIITVVNKGSVITKDAGIALYAEKSLIAIDEKNKKEFITLINSRISGLEKESQIKRINKVLRDVEKA